MIECNSKIVALLVAEICKFICYHRHYQYPQYLFRSNHCHSQCTPAFSSSILQSSFCVTLIEEGLERSSLHQSLIQHLVRNVCRAIPILELQKTQKSDGGNVGAVHRVCKNFNFSIFQKFYDNRNGVWLSVVVVQKPYWCELIDSFN